MPSLSSTSNDQFHDIASYANKITGSVSTTQSSSEGKGFLLKVTEIKKFSEALKLQNDNNLLRTNISQILSQVKPEHLDDTKHIFVKVHDEGNIEIFPLKAKPRISRSKPQFTVRDANGKRLIPTETNSKAYIALNKLVQLQEANPPRSPSLVRSDSDLRLKPAPETGSQPRLTKESDQRKLTRDIRSEEKPAIPVDTRPVKTSPVEPETLETTPSKVSQKTAEPKTQTPKSILKKSKVETDEAGKTGKKVGFSDSTQVDTFEKVPEDLKEEVFSSAEELDSYKQRESKDPKGFLHDFEAQIDSLYLHKKGNEKGEKDIAFSELPEFPSEESRQSYIKIAKDFYENQKADLAEKIETLHKLANEYNLQNENHNPSELGEEESNIKGKQLKNSYVRIKKLESDIQKLEKKLPAVTSYVEEIINKALAKPIAKPLKPKAKPLPGILGKIGGF